LLALGLLGGHVCNRAHRGSGTGEVLGHCGVDGWESGVSLASGLRGDFGKSEVEDLGVSALGDKDIRGFDIAVHDAFGVGGIEGIGDLDPERQ
jgi:hypothetical protein